MSATPQSLKISSSALGTVREAGRVRSFCNQSLKGLVLFSNKKQTILLSWQTSDCVRESSAVNLPVLGKNHFRKLFSHSNSFFLSKHLAKRRSSSSNTGVCLLLFDAAFNSTKLLPLDTRLVLTRHPTHVKPDSLIRPYVCVCVCLFFIFTSTLC